MNEVCLCGTTWMNLQNIMLGQKASHHLITVPFLLKKKIEQRKYVKDAECMGYK